jgi:hypothetical protein
VADLIRERYLVLLTDDELKSYLREDEIMILNSPQVEGPIVAAVNFLHRLGHTLKVRPYDSSNSFNNLIFLGFY